MPATVFVVRRKVPAEVTRDTIPKPAEQYAATFATAAAAADYARLLDRREKEATDPNTFNPFFSMVYDDLTTFPPHVFRDWLLDVGIDPPPQVAGKHQQLKELEDVAWAEWWRKTATTGDLSAERWQKVWEGLNRLSFFEVEEVDTPETSPTKNPKRVYAVVRNDWTYNDYMYDGHNEAVAVYRTRAKAEAEAARQAEDIPNGRFVVIELPFAPEVE